MGDINNFNIHEIPDSKKSKQVTLGDINVGRKSPQELEAIQFNEEVQAQIADTDSIFNLRTLDQATQEQLSKYAKMYYERRRISEPSIQALFQYHFQELLRNMQRDYDLFVMDIQMEDLMLKNFGMKREDLEKFKF